MANFEVSVPINVTYTVVVEAEDADAAILKVGDSGDADLPWISNHHDADDPSWGEAEAIETDAEAEE